MATQLHGNTRVDICQVVTTLGPAKPQRLASGHASSTEASEAREAVEIQEMEIEQEMRALLSSSSPVRSHPSNLAETPPHRLCLETSFTSLQSPSEFPQAGRELSVDSRGIDPMGVRQSGQRIAQHAKGRGEQIVRIALLRTTNGRLTTRMSRIRFKILTMNYWGSLF